MRKGTGLLSIALVTIMVLTVASGAIVARADASTVPSAMQYRNTVDRTGDYSPVAGPGPVVPNERWSRYVGATLSSPVAADGYVYVEGTEQQTLNGYTGYYNYVYAYNGRGDRVWRNGPTGFTNGGKGMLELSPAVVNGVVYVGGSNGYIYALDAATGATKWNKKLSAYLSYQYGGSLSSPAVVNGIVYVTIGHWDNGYGGAGSTGLFALDAATGAVKWKYILPESESLQILRTAPVVADGVVYVRNAYWLYAMNATTGALLWHTQALMSDTGLYSITPVVYNGVVYCIDLLAYDSPAAVDRMIPVDAKTGQPINYLSAPSHVLSAPCIVNNVMYLMTTDGLYALDVTKTEQTYITGYSTVPPQWAGTFHIKWEVKIGSVSSSSPAYANGVVYVGGADKLYAVNATTGMVDWTIPVGSWGDHVSSPVIAGEHAYIVADDSLHDIGIEEPTITWVTATPATVTPDQQFVLQVGVDNPDNLQLSNYVWEFTPGSGGLPTFLAHGDPATGTATLSLPEGGYLVSVGVDWSGPSGSKGTVQTESTGPHTYVSVVAPKVQVGAVQTNVNTLLTRVFDRAKTDQSAFTTSQNYKTYTNKLNALSATIGAHRYAEAQDKIQNDLLKRDAQWVKDPATRMWLDNELHYISVALARLQTG